MFNKKSKAPDKLPDLTLDHISTKIKNDKISNPNLIKDQDLKIENIQHNNQSIIKAAPKINLIQNTPNPISNQSEKNFEHNVIMPENSQVKSNPFDDKSFFKELMYNLDNKSKSSQDIKSWYNENFSSQDIVSQMKSYWESQKPELVLKGNELKGKIMEKADKLHLMEKEWQEAYLKTISKESEIGKHEQELKKMINEFMEITRNTLK